MLALTGCNKNKTESTIDSAVDKTKSVAADAGNAMADAWGDVKSYTFEKSSDFQKSLKAMSSKFDADVSKMKADYSEANASAARKAAMAEFKDSESNFKQKMSALGNATSATWDSAKKDVIAAWDRLQASYYKARAN